MNDQTARFIGIILAIVATAVVNRVLADKRIAALEDRVEALIEQFLGGSSSEGGTSAPGSGANSPGTPEPPQTPQK